MKGLSPEDFDKLKETWQPGSTLGLAGSIFSGAFGLGSSMGQAEEQRMFHMKQRQATERQLAGMRVRQEQQRAEPNYMQIYGSPYTYGDPERKAEEIARELVETEEKKMWIDEPDDKTVLEKLVDRFEEWTEDIFDFSYLDDVKVNPYEEEKVEVGSAGVYGLTYKDWVVARKYMLPLSGVTA